jgi:parallel beta-helix repeat protein
MKSTRTIKTAGPLGFLLVAVPLLLAVGPNACPIDVQCGDVLDVDYGQYRLNGDLECPFSTMFAAVTITGVGVHFNLAGHTITRDDVSGAFLSQGIAVRSANVHINGGSVVDFNCPALPDSIRTACAAIRLWEAPGVQINGMSLHNNTVGIISFQSPRGNSDEARIHGNDITGNLHRGISLFGTAFGAVITDNDLSDTGGWIDPDLGLVGYGYFGNAKNVSLIDNVANRCDSVGILLWGGGGGQAQFNTVRSNTTLDNGSAGISTSAFQEGFRPRLNLIQSNTSFGNGLRDLFDGIAFAPTSESCLNTWKDNDFDVAEPDCIE